MATVSERLALIVTANGTQAITELNRIGTASKTQLGQAERSIDQVSSKMIGLGAASVAGGAVASRALFGLAQSAAQLIDATQAADVTFGTDLSASLEQFAANAEKTLGLSKRNVVETSQLFATFGKDAGLSGRELLDFSTNLVQVGVDIASLKGVSNDQVFTAIQSGLAGEIEPLRRLGITLDDTKKKAEAVRLGLRAPGDNSVLKTYEKVLTTRSLIEQSPLALDAKGDFARTIDTLPNQLKIAEAAFENLRAEVGESLAPAFANLVSVGTATFDVFNKLPGPVKELAGSLALIASLGAVAGGGLSLVAGGLLKLVPATATAAFTQAGGGIKGLTAAVRTLNPAVVGATAAIGAGLGIYEAWASNAERVDQEIQALTESVTTITDKAQVLPQLAEQFNQILNTRSGGTDAFDKTGLAISDVVEAVNAAPGGLDEFRDSVDGAFGSLENLDGITGSLFNIGGGIDGVREAAENAPGPVRNLLLNLIDLYEANRLSAGELRAVIDYMTDLDRAAAGSSDGVRFQAEQLWKVVPAAQRSADAMRLYQAATDRTAGVDAQADALNQLKSLFPEAAAAAGFLSTALGGVQDSAAEAADAVRDTADAADSLKSANDRVASAQKRLADATKRDGKAIEDAYERVVAAKERLDDILAGDGNNLEQESPQAQEERARAKLREAQLRLAANPNDALAQADKAEALQAITDAQQRGQDLLRNAQDIARQTRDAKRDLEDAQQSYNETLRGNPEEVTAAREELAKAERDRAQLLAELGVAFQEGKISVEAYKAELDRQVAAGIISPESAAILKGQVDSLATQVGLAGAALGQIPGMVDEVKASIAQREGIPAHHATPGAQSRQTSAIGPEGRSPLTAAAGLRIGLGDNVLEMNGQITTDNQGRRWSWNGRQWIPRATGGPITAGQGYLVGERGPELIVPGAPGYVLNADRTKALTGGSGATWNVTNNIRSTDPKRAAAETVRRMKARKYLLQGA